MINLNNIQVSREKLLFEILNTTNPFYIVNNTQDFLFKLVNNNNKIVVFDYQSEQSIDISKELLYNYLNLDESHKIYTLSGVSLYLNKLEEILTNIPI